MEREKAVDKLAQVMLLKMSPDERRDQLEAMVGENWSESVYWPELPAKLKRGFIDDQPIGELNSTLYDPILLMSLKDKLAPVTNEFLASALKIETIVGKPAHREACPCCGIRTLEERGVFDICLVCWWEDDGLDNRNAEMQSGPNEGLSLTQARLNYQKYGIYNPTRTDLMKLKEHAGKYERGRNFRVVNGHSIEEIE